MQRKHQVLCVWAEENQNHGWAWGVGAPNYPQRMICEGSLSTEWSQGCRAPLAVPTLFPCKKPEAAQDSLEILAFAFATCSVLSSESSSVSGSALRSPCHFQKEPQTPAVPAEAEQILLLKLPSNSVSALGGNKANVFGFFAECLETGMMLCTKPHTLPEGGYSWQQDVSS